MHIYAARLLVRSLVIAALVLVCLQGASPARSDSPIALVKDIRTSTHWGSSQPREFVRSGGLTFFIAGTTQHGEELWRTDGTTEGTALVRDIWPGSTGSNPHGLIPFKGTLYFTASDGVHGYELWKSDGTAEGTVLLKDFHPGTEATVGLGPFTIWNGSLFFTARDSEGRGLFRSDGTAEGTVRLTEGDANFHHFTLVGDTLFLTRNFSQLWKSDGTPEGTVPVYDFGAGWSVKGQNLTSFNGRLFFIGANEESSVDAGTALWESDGTSQGTRIVKTIAYYSGEFDTKVVVFNGALYFMGDIGASGYGLWRSDGTPQGTRLFKDINPNIHHSMTPQLTVSGDRLYFIADDGRRGYELWMTRGSESSTRLVQDIYPGEASSEIDKMVDVNGVLYFFAYDGPHGKELWRSDPSDTRMVKDISPGEVWGAEGLTLHRVGDLLYFAANDGVHGPEPWVSDGSAAGTRMLADIERHPGSDPVELVKLNGLIFFTADDGTTGRELWRSDGTEGGTIRLTDLPPSAIPSPIYDLTTSGSRLFFGVEYEDELSYRSYGLWVSDGTPEQTRELKRFQNYSHLWSIAPSNLLDVGGRLFFLNNDGAVRVWTSDGTPEGTTQIKTIDSGDKRLRLVSALTVGTTLYFVMQDAYDEWASLWRSDGTAAGTEQIPLTPDFDQLGQLTYAGGKIFMIGRRPVPHDIFELWTVNPTSATATRLIMFKGISTPTSSFIYSPVPLGDQLLFGIVAPDTPELWRSDGTPGGTAPVFDLPGPASARITGAAAVGDSVMFAYGNDANNTLWRSDGTAEGTAPIAPVGAGPVIFNSPHTITQGWPDGRAVLVGSSGRDGLELWWTDGTAAGTGLLHDIAPGPASSNPDGFTIAGNYVFFTAEDGEHGRELWALDRAAFNSAPVAYDQEFGPSGGGTVRGRIGAHDADGGPLSFRIVRHPHNGEVTLIDASAGTFVYTARAGATGRDSFTYVVSDGLAESDEAEVFVRPELEIRRGSLYLPLLRQ